MPKFYFATILHRCEKNNSNSSRLQKSLSYPRSPINLPLQRQPDHQFSTLPQMVPIQVCKYLFLVALNLCCDLFIIYCPVPSFLFTDAISVLTDQLHFFPFVATSQPMEFPGQGSDPSCSCHLSRSCGNAGSLTHCARLGNEPESQRSQDASDPVVPQRELLINSIFQTAIMFYCMAMPWFI